MFNVWIHPKAHYFLHIVGLCLIAVGLPLNKVVMSVGTIWIISNWLIELNFKEKFQNLKSNKLAWFVLALFFLHFVGLIWSENMQYGFRDIEKKLPLFVVPFVLGSKDRMDKTTFLAIVYSFLSCLAITSFINIFNQWSNGVTAYRDISIFGSHIRYALLVNIGIATSVFLIFKQKMFRYIFILLAIWFVFYTLFSKVFTGYILFLAQLVVLFFYFVFKSRKTWLKVTFSVLFLGGVIFSFSYLNQIWKDVQIKDSFSLNDLPEKTKQGNKYKHAVDHRLFENGHGTNLYLCEKELKPAWNERSQKKYLEVSENGFPLKYRLIRYLTSKGLPKDAEGMSKLTQQDIKNIESGMTSIVQTKNPIDKLLYEFFENIVAYQAGGDPNHNSFLQRMEHFKIGKLIFSENWLIGTGTGDVQDAFDEMYVREKSNLLKDYHYRAHNQFLTFGITFGILGFILALTIIFLPMFLRRNRNLLAYLFFAIVLLSFLFSDLLETQVGVTFFALFYAIIYLSRFNFTQQLQPLRKN